MHFCSVPPVWERINKLLGTALQAKKNRVRIQRKENKTGHELYRAVTPNGVNTEKFIKYFLNNKVVRRMPWRSFSH